ncbi:MAG TPA: hypothetical protein VFH83_10965 [Spirochaetia bacterium]|nr:hypothetical protein [Spirochaetia bacterium]
MRRICAWCKAPLNREKAGPISHGICEPCSVYVLSEKFRFRDFLESIEAPLLAVDGEGRAITANTVALKTLGKGMPQVGGRLPGEVMECEYSRLPGGCGKTVHCNGCQIRMSVDYTRSTGEARVRTRAYIRIQESQGVKQYDYYVSTEKLDGVVLLRIDETRPCGQGGGVPAGKVDAEPRAL